MKSILLYSHLIVFLFFSCASEEKKQKKELSGPHAVIRLFVQTSENFTFYGSGDSLPLATISTDDKLNESYSVMMQSDTLLKKTLLKMGRKGTEDEIGSIRENLKFTTLDKTDILQIELYFEEEKFACAFLDMLVDILNEDVMDQRRDGMNKKVAHIDKQLEEVRNLLEEATEQLREDNQILDIGNESQVYFEEYLKIQTNQKILQEIRDCLQREKDDCWANNTALATGFDEFLEASLTKLYKLSLEKNNIQCPKPNNEACKKLDKEINTLKSDLDEYLKNSLLALEEQTKQYEAYIKKLPKTKHELSRQFEVNQKMYEFLIEKKMELSIAGAGFISPILKVDKARWERK